MAQTVPTKSNLLNVKKSYDLAKLGYDLMDRKRNILVREMMTLIDSAREKQKEISALYAEAYEALAKAYITLGDCDVFAENVPVDRSVHITRKSVMGVELTEIRHTRHLDFGQYGLMGTNSMLDEAYLKFQKAKEMTIELAALENNVCRLADAVKKTKKRANALENIMIPRFAGEVKFITDSLEEKEREDFSRLKVTKKQTKNKK